MSVITANNLREQMPLGSWMPQLKPSLAALVGSGHPLMDVLNLDYQGRHAVHHVFTFGLRDLAAGKELDESAKCTGWRFLASGHRELPVGGGCHATDESARGPAKVVTVLEAPEIVELIANTEKLNHLPELKKHPGNVYELRVLRIPGLYVEGFWLKLSKGRGGDWMVPYGILLDAGRKNVKLPKGKHLAMMKALGMVEFLKTIQPLAERRLGFDDSPRY